MMSSRILVTALRKSQVIVPRAFAAQAGSAAKSTSSPTYIYGSKKEDGKDATSSTDSTWDKAKDAACDAKDAAKSKWDEFKSESKGQSTSEKVETAKQKAGELKDDLQSKFGQNQASTNESKQSSSSSGLGSSSTSSTFASSSDANKSSSGNQSTSQSSTSGKQSSQNQKDFNNEAQAAKIDQWQMEAVEGDRKWMNDKDQASPQRSKGSSGQSDQQTSSETGTGRSEKRDLQDADQYGPRGFQRNIDNDQSQQSQFGSNQQYMDKFQNDRQGSSAYRGDFSGGYGSSNRSEQDYQSPTTRFGLADTLARRQGQSGWDQQSSEGQNQGRGQYVQTSRGLDWQSDKPVFGTSQKGHSDVSGSGSYSGRESFGGGGDGIQYTRSDAYSRQPQSFGTATQEQGNWQDQNWSGRGDNRQRSYSAEDYRTGQDYRSGQENWQSRGGEMYQGSGAQNQQGSSRGYGRGYDNQPFGSSLGHESFGPSGKQYGGSQESSYSSFPRYGSGRQQYGTSGRGVGRSDQSTQYGQGEFDRSSGSGSSGQYRSRQQGDSSAASDYGTTGQYGSRSYDSNQRYGSGSFESQQNRPSRKSSSGEQSFGGQYPASGYESQWESSGRGNSYGSSAAMDRADQAGYGGSATYGLPVGSSRIAEGRNLNKDLTGDRNMSRNPSQYRRSQSSDRSFGYGGQDFGQNQSGQNQSYYQSAGSYGSDSFVGDRSGDVSRDVANDVRNYQRSDDQSLRNDNRENWNMQGRYEDRDNSGLTGRIKSAVHKVEDMASSAWERIKHPMSGSNDSEGNYRDRIPQ